MKRLAALLLLASCASPPPAPVAPPAAIETAEVPPLPREIADRLARYQELSGTAFEDWLPDGSALVSTRAGATVQLHVVAAPGARREQITRSSEPVANGVALPDGDILYSQGRGGDENYQIYRLLRKSGESRLLTDGKSRNTMGPLSRRGDRLVFSTNRRNGRDTDLCLLDPATGAAETVLEAQGEFWVATDWSPDDSKLLLLRIVSVNENHPFLLDLKTRERTPLPVAAERAAHGSPRFSPDGSHVLLSSDAGGEFKRLHSVGLRIDYKVQMDLEAGRLQGDVEDLEISASRVVVSVNENGASRLWGPSLPDLPLGVISGLRFSRDGRRLGFTLSRADALSDVYSIDFPEGKLVRWTTSGTPGLDPATFVVPERIAYESFDGRRIPAYVYRPRGARKAPVVISIHGGPESQYRPFFSSVTQAWVNELGVAVIAPNVRGSTGYGKTYVALDNAEKREDAVRDIGALLDWIARQPDLDASRVAVHGGSYGGYMVLASLVHFGDRLRAGVDIVGIANFTTFLEKTSGYRVDLRRVEYGDERKPEMQEFFRRISPANHAEKIRSALLVAHGRNDPRVPFFEAEQIAAKVRAQGRPVWTVFAANEGHGFARKENRDYVGAVTALFFRRFLLD